MIKKSHECHSEGYQQSSSLGLHPWGGPKATHWLPGRRGAAFRHYAHSSWKTGQVHSSEMDGAVSPQVSESGTPAGRIVPCSAWMMVLSASIVLPRSEPTWGPNPSLKALTNNICSGPHWRVFISSQFDPDFSLMACKYSSSETLLNCSGF